MLVLRAVVTRKEELGKIKVVDIPGDFGGALDKSFGPLGHALEADAEMRRQITEVPRLRCFSVCFTIVALKLVQLAEGVFPQEVPQRYVCISIVAHNFHLHHLKSSRWLLALETGSCCNVDSSPISVNY